MNKKGTTRQAPIGKSDRNGPKGNQVIVIQGQRLCRSEEELLQECEELITNGLKTFFEVGSALLAIRDARLYRDRYGSFDTYCHERWGFGRTYAWRVIGAAERLKLLQPGDEIRKPTSEFQMRPFLKLAPEDFPGVWKQVLEKAKDGKITSDIIGGLIDGIHDKKEKPPLLQQKKISFAKGTIGEIIVLLSEIKRQIESNEADKAVPTLERIEHLLFSKAMKRRV